MGNNTIDVLIRDLNMTTYQNPLLFTNQPNYDQPRTIHFIAIGTIIPVGLIFNMLSLLVFSTSLPLRKTTTGHYLMALAVADSLFLIGEFIHWLNTPNMHHINVKIYFMDNYDAICKFVYLLRYTSTLASAWITVAITIERFITVALPLKVSQISTPLIAKIAILVVFVGSFGLSLFTIWAVGVTSYKTRTACLITSHKVYDIGNWISLRVGSFLLPGLLMFAFTSLIILYLSRAREIRTNTLNSSVTFCKVSRQISTNTLEKQLTLTLVAVAVAFLVLRLPYTVMFYIQIYKLKMFPGLDVWTSYRIYYAYKITDIFVSINYAVNFLLYCFCGSAFRLQMMNLFHCKKQRSYTHKYIATTTSLQSRSISALSDYDNNLKLSPHGTKMVTTIPCSKKYGDSML